MRPAIRAVREEIGSLGEDPSPMPGAWSEFVSEVAWCVAAVLVVIYWHVERKQDAGPDSELPAATTPRTVKGT